MGQTWRDGICTMKSTWKVHNSRTPSKAKTCPGVYFLRDSVDPACKRGQSLNGAGVYLLTSCRRSKFTSVRATVW